MNSLEEANVRILQLEAEIRVMRDADLEGKARLRQKGLDNGAKGVKAAFILAGIIYLVSVAVEVATGKALASTPNLIGLGIVLCVALIAYFGFIFQYTVAAEVSKERFQVETKGAVKLEP